MRVRVGQAPSICSANMECFLLERSRVTRAPLGERLYHIYYQLIAGASAEERTKLRLNANTADYAYLTGSHPPQSEREELAAAMKSSRAALDSIRSPVSRALRRAQRVHRNATSQI